jgi:hypothetical protein
VRKEDTLKQAIILLLLTGVGTQLSSATVQRPERLVYEEKQFLLLSTPLESFLSALAKRPYFGPGGNTALARGYVGKWEIRNGFLYLVGLLGADDKPINLTAVFPGRAGEIKASWFSGDMRVGQGEILRPAYGLASIYEKELFFTIKGGKVRRIEIIDRIEEMRSFRETVKKLERSNAQFGKDQYLFSFSKFSQQAALWLVPKSIEGFEVFEFPLGSPPGSKGKKRIVRTRHFAVTGYCEFELEGAPDGDVSLRKTKLRPTDRHRVYLVESIFRRAPETGERSLVAFAGDEVVWLMFSRYHRSNWQEATSDALKYTDLILKHRRQIDREE